MLKRVLMWGGVIIAVAVIGFFVWRANREEPFVPRALDEVAAETNDPKEIVRYMERLEEAYRNDAYGGDTPEETLNLFIAALKAGDTDLAAKYFLLEEQERMKKELKQGIQSGGVGAFLQSFSIEKRGSKSSDSRYTFRAHDKETNADFIVDLIQSPYTKKWKIESL